MITCSGFAETHRKRPKIWANWQMLQKSRQDEQVYEAGNVRIVWHYGLKCLIGPGETVPVLETRNLLSIFNSIGIFSSLRQYSFQQIALNRAGFSRDVPPTENFRGVQSTSANLLQVRVVDEDD